MTLAPEAPAVREEEEPNSLALRITVGVFIVVPFLALLAAIPAIALGWFSWVDAALLFVFWFITGMGITLGYHRHFTHRSFKAPHWVSVVLAVAGSLALEGSIAQWVADHRKHHKFSDMPGDPHSPWRFGTSKRAVAKGLVWAHMGWLVEENSTSIAVYAPDIMADRAFLAVSRHFKLIVAASLLLPAILGGLITWSWWGALTGFFWAGLVRIALVHHVTWSINSICHVFGKRPFRTRDRSTNVWWLSIASFGESWHNLHHADPTAARHGVFKGQLDISARSIAIMERLKLAYDVRWPKPERLATRLEDPTQASRLRGYAA